MGIFFMCCKMYRLGELKYNRVMINNMPHDQFCCPECGKSFSVYESTIDPATR